MSNEPESKTCYSYVGIRHKNDNLAAAFQRFVVKDGENTSIAEQAPADVTEGHLHLFTPSELYAFVHAMSFKSLEKGTSVEFYNSAQEHNLEQLNRGKRKLAFCAKEALDILAPPEC